MCGEQGDGEVDEVLLEGSPPRVRGTVRRGSGNAPGQGITPACAGNSYPARFRRFFGQDHPRVCGEQQ